jgi:endonuclease-8
MLMSGSWHIYRPGERWQRPRTNMRILIENSEYVAVAFNVPVAKMLQSDEIERVLPIPQTAVDLLSQEFDMAEVARRMMACGAEEIGDVLLRQQVIAGVGNLFKSEVCYVTATNPFSRVAALDAEKIQALIATSRRLLKANVIEDSDQVFVTDVGRRRRTTHESDPGASLWVYGRQGEPCRRCGEPIRRRLQGPDARVTFWCPQCQPMPDGSDPDR